MEKKTGTTRGNGTRPQGNPQRKPGTTPKKAGNSQKKPRPQTNKKAQSKKNDGAKIRNIFIAVILATVVIILGATLFFTTDRVIENDNPSAEESELISTVSSDETGFPVSFSNHDIIDAESFSSTIFVLGKKLLTFVTADGTVKHNEIFTFSDPQMVVSDKYGMVYDKVSPNYFIFNNKGVIYKGETENGKQIITAKINNSGDVAMVTKSEDSACRVSLINKKGEVRYIWSCAEEYAVCLDLDHSGEDILCGAIGSEKGVVYSKLYLLNIYSDKVEAEFRIDDSAIVDAAISGRKLIATCNEGRYIFDSRSNDQTAQAAAEYSSKITAFSCDDSGNTAVVTNKSGAFGTHEITVYNKNNAISYRGYTDETIVDILCRGKKVYILTDAAIYESLSDGTFERVSSEDISGERMVICKRTMYYYSKGQINVNS